MGKKKWYLPSEVVVHNTLDDIWLVAHHKIFDLTQFIKRYIPEGGVYCGRCGGEQCACNTPREMRILLAFAGKDVSHWLNDGVYSYKKYMHAVSKTEDIFARHGTFPQTSGVAPSTWWRPAEEPLWFEDESLVVGFLTKNPRPIQIVNTLTGDHLLLDVCEEETILEIMEHRFLPHNRHYSSYTWLYKGIPIDLTKNLTENGIKDEREMFLEVGLREDVHVPSILIYYNDDFTDDYPCFCGFR